MATAIPRRRANQCEMSASNGAKVAELPSNPINTPWISANSHSVSARLASTQPRHRLQAAITSGTVIPKRSISRPIRTPPNPKPIMSIVNGNEAAARSTPNSA